MRRIYFRRIGSCLSVRRDIFLSAIPVEMMLAPVRQIDGFVLACLADASSGMILGSLQDETGTRLPVAAAGVVSVLPMMTGELAADGTVEDVIVAVGGHYHLIRLFRPGPARRLLLRVTPERLQASLAMVYREIGDFSAGLCGERDWVA